MASPGTEQQQQLQLAACGHRACAAISCASPTYHSNALNALPKLLQARGLQPACSGELALLAAWRRSAGGPVARRSKAAPEVCCAQRRGLVELCPLGSCAELGDKRRLAKYLKRHGVESWAPLTLFSPCELRLYDVGSSSLWFLKHSRMERNEGVSVHLGSSACYDAWLAIPEPEQQDYIAQQEVPSVLLDSAGRKLTMRIYVLLLAACEINEPTDNKSIVSCCALARKEFVCRAHPLPYRASDADPARHIHSTLDTFAGVEGTLSSAWPQSQAMWPEVRRMLQQCLEPFFPTFACSHSGLDGVGALGFEILGVDVLVDTSLRPWLVEVNQGPALLPIRGNPEASAAREAVLDDLLKAALDPVRQGSCLQELVRGSNSLVLDGWDRIGAWSNQPGLTTAA